jgi:hypothetical protein
MISVIENTCIGQLTRFRNWRSMNLALPRSQVKQTMTIEEEPTTILASIKENISLTPAVTQHFGAPVPAR